MKQTFVLATHNTGKVEEFQQMLEDAPFELVLQSQFNITDIEETQTTFIGNALLKAHHAAKQTGLPAIADDSGLTVPALNDAPGVYSARYAGKHGDSVANNAKVLAKMQAVPDDQCQATFHCCLVLFRHADDPAPMIAQGTWSGKILRAEKGDQGFGYDPIFYVPEYQCSAAELEPALKNRISHRARALQKLLSLMKTL